jgi:hypothetical protein
MTERLGKSPAASSHRDEWEYTNTSHDVIDFVIEPEGDIVQMPPGATYQVIAEGPSTGKLVTRETEEQVTVYAWPGSTLTVTCDGEVIA